MCTLIINWNPGSDCPLVVGANRDENPNRVSESWAYRGKILCPLDARKGTWIGINQSGVFSALTNLDINEVSPGRESRGNLVLRSLMSTTNAKQAAYTVTGMLLDEIYNPFNIVFIDNNYMIVIVGYGHTKRFETLFLEPGFHIITPMGIDSEVDPRHIGIRESVLNGIEFQEILCHHAPKERAVCIHESGHVTRSSAIITVKDFKVEVLSSDVPPCRDEWNVSRMELGC